MYLLIKTIKELICKYDPQHVGSVVANAIELATLLVLFIMVVKLFRKTKALHKQMKEYHPDDK